jgi:protein-ribulosamine 3-kinase
VTIPDAILQEIEPMLGRIRAAVPVGGGCVSDAARVDTDGGAVFVKYDVASPPGMFDAEAAGLHELRSASSPLRVPEVRGQGEGWLALEWLEVRPRTAATEGELGRGLAELHRTSAGRWGWHRAGFIGPLAQDNECSAGWGEFWVARRLEPQLRMARDAGAAVGDAAGWSRLFAALPAALSAAEEDGDSLLHGDLWSGNALACSDGRPALIDPAAYYGHREVDLAMAELFGGFDPGFNAGYAECWPLAPGYAEVRRGAYQLYYLLVHVNLFGGGYAARTRGVLDQTLRGL